MTALSEWQNFYVIVGSSAGALIGLQFVVITLIAAMPIGRGTAQAGAAFSTPNVVHFGAVLLLAGILSAPWGTILPAAFVWGLVGLSGIVYEIIVARRMQRATCIQARVRRLVVSCLLPFAAYATLAVTAFMAGSNLRGALFCIGAAALLLLFVGIHNAWDAVTYHVFEKKPTS